MRSGSITEPPLATGGLSSQEAIASDRHPIGGPQREVTLFDFLIRLTRLLVARRVFLLRFLGIAALLLIVSMLLIQPRYKSTISLIPPESNSASSGLASIAALASGSGGAAASLIPQDLLGKSNTGLYLQVLRSRTLADRLIQRFNLMDAYEKRYFVDARKRLFDNTDIAEDKKSNLISVTVTDTDRNRATAIASAYAEELNRLMAEVNTSAAHKERVFLEERRKEVKKQLDEDSQLLAQFAAKNKAVDLGAETKAMFQQVGALQSALISAQVELRQMEETYAPDNPRLKQIRSRVNELKQQLSRVNGKEGRISSEDSSLPSIRELPQLGVSYYDFYRNLRIQESVFETLTKQYELVRVQEAKEVPLVKVLDKPEMAEKRAWPKPWLVLPIGLTLSLLLGVIWIALESVWQGMDSADPRKTLVREMSGSNFL